MKTRIDFLSTSRADFGTIFEVLRLAAISPELDCRVLFCSDAELLQSEVTTLNCPVISLSSKGLPGATQTATESISSLTCALAGCLAASSPDCLVLAGDRYELLAVLSAAIVQRIPMAHLSGGELTLGAFDEQIRHAVTKASHLHFVANTVFAKRVLQMGEEEWRVKVTGDPGLDRVHRADLAPAEEVESVVSAPVDRTTITVAYHPVTAHPEQTWVEWQAIEDALEDYPGTVVVTASNADPQGLELRERQQKWCLGKKTRSYVLHLGQRRFLGLLNHGGCLLGNSSSGIWEAPSLKTPAVNLGSRQEERLRAANVLDVPHTNASSVRAALQQALDPAFRDSLSKMVNPYGDGAAAERIVQALRELPPRSRLLHKRFVDR